MKASAFDTLIHTAAREGVLPEQTAPFEQDSRPWPVVLLTALGAWLAAIPLIGVVAITLGSAVKDNAGVYVIGALVLAGTVVALRSKTLPLFVEQLAVPGLLVGGCTLGFGFFRDMDVQVGAVAVALLSLGVAVLIPRAWLRVLLGAASAILLAVAFVPRDWFRGGEEMFASFWFAWHAVAALTGVAAFAQSRLFAGGTFVRVAAMLESVLAGSLLAVLAALSWWSGMPFLVGATVRLHKVIDAGAASSLRAEDLFVLQAASVVFALAAAAWLAKRWPSVRKPWCAGVAAVFIGLAWFMPALGAVLLALAVCAACGRWRLASASAVAAAWIIGSFYYGLDWPLSTKSLVLVVAGVVLGGLAWFASRSGRSMPSSSTVAMQSAPRHTRAGVALTLLAVLAVANAGIWQKERLAVAHGSVFVELAPRDPRSLMQGDYMSLNFRLPREVLMGLDKVEPSAHPRVVAKRDKRGVATLIRLDDGTALATDELRIQLTLKEGRWLLVTDAWFFKEGEAQRYAPAKFGEFKVDSEGGALLVGMRGANLEPL